MDPLPLLEDYIHERWLIYHMHCIGEKYWCMHRKIATENYTFRAISAELNRPRNKRLRKIKMMKNTRLKVKSLKWAEKFRINFNSHNVHTDSFTKSSSIQIGNCWKRVTIKWNTKRLAWLILVWHIAIATYKIFIHHSERLGEGGRGWGGDDDDDDQSLHRGGCRGTGIVRIDQ